MIRLILLCLFSLSISISSFGQNDYIPMLQEDARWMEEMSVTGMGVVDYPHTYALKGDSVVNDTLYKKLYAVYGYLRSDEDFATDTAYLHSLVRETPEGQVYFRRVNYNLENAYTDFLLYNASSAEDDSDTIPTNREYLLCDFSLSEGDTVPYHTRTISEVDYMQIGGESRKVLHLSLSYQHNTAYYCSAEMTWIEGIGPVPTEETEEQFFFMGYKCPYFIIEVNTTFRCYQNLSTEYPIELCSSTLSNPEAEPPLDFKIYPNPASDWCTLTWSSSNKPGRVIIYNLTGKQVATMPVNNNDSERIDLNGLEAGVYILELTRKGEALGRQKLVVR